MIVLLLFVHLLVVDLIIVIPSCTKFQEIKRIDYKDITTVLKNLHWLKIQDRIIYTILMLTYKSYYNIAPSYFGQLICKKRKSGEYSVGNRTDQQQIIIPRIIEDCSNTFLQCSCIYSFILIVSGRAQQFYLHYNMDAD